MTNTRDHDQYLEQLLGRQLRRIRQRFLIHGIAWMVAAVALAIVLYYPLDRYLRLPGGVRIFLSLALAGYLVYLLRRFVLYPMSREVTRRDVALAIEESFPELNQKLISAVQLAKAVDDPAAAPTGPRNQSREMIEKLVADAAAHANKIPHEQLLDARPTVRAWTAALALGLIVVGFGAAYPDVSGVFLQRVFGLSATYPRDTMLVIEHPSTQDESRAEYRVVQDGEDLIVTLAAGGDLPVVVRADGVVPREVQLVIEGGRGLPPTIAMSSRGPQRFKHSFRRIAGEFSFYARGGDDFGGEGVVRVRVLHPPRVEMVKTTVRFPAYTRKPDHEQTGGSVEALVGSQLAFEVSATAEVQSAKIKFLESGQELELAKRTVQAGDGQRIVYTGDFPVARSDRYQVSLVGKAGLPNPHPGTYHIVAIPDHPPVGRIITPADDDLNVSLLDGIVPVRIAATDDFGLASIDLLVQSNDGDDGQTIEMYRPKTAETVGDAPEPDRQVTVLTLVDLVKPEYKERAKIGESLMITGKLVDNQTPAPKTKDVGPRQVQLVGETDLLRRVSAHFRRVRENVEQNLQLMKDRHERLEDIQDEVEGGTTIKAQQLPITAVEVGQGRVQSAAMRIHRELMRALDFYLFNRQEPSTHATTVLSLYQSFHERLASQDRFFPAFYRDLTARRKSGQLGAMDKLDPILEMIDSADRIAVTLAPEALKFLARSRIADSNADAVAALTEAGKRQTAMIKEFELLLSRLDTWNEFQDVITNTRSLLDRQRDIQTRTQNLSGDKGK